MGTTTGTRETIGVRRMPSVQGTEVLDAEHSPRIWRIFNLGFSIAVLRTWHGKVLYRRRELAVTPGMVFMVVPGEVHTATPASGHCGSFNVVILEPSQFRQCLLERNGRDGSPDWRKVADRASPSMLAELGRFIRTMQPAYSEMEQQSAQCTLIDRLAQELLEDSCHRSAPKLEGLRAAERVRECLHSTEGARMDLDSLAKATGMSRFQVLRSFRRRYGLTPHAYQLCLRVALARQMLVEGFSVTQASAECGFTDPSHFARHFKRTVGISPKQYARTSYELPLRRGTALRQDWIISALTQSDALRCADFRAAFTKQDGARVTFGGQVVDAVEPGISLEHREVSAEVL